ncbi:protein MTO1 homolog, mitochondrial-like [Limulus polyphemus]|uniref:Protein MTO1 homolog, mitochondrial-like n=1 Tax=Limulus polyphemus TaxID=6850 RepID=A0ABM1S092_LIMPO|nr:protein MTO1 homolog, mitochondrial-like [Limulus polyphemus]
MKSHFLIIQRDTLICYFLCFSLVICLVVKKLKFILVCKFILLCLLRAFELLGLQEVTLEMLVTIYSEQLQPLLKDVHLASRLKIEALYDQIVEEQFAEMQQVKKDETLELPDDLDYFG